MKKYDYISLLHKQATKQLSTEEELALNKWLADKDNQSLASDVHTIWEMSEEEDLSFQPDVEAGLERFKQSRISTNKPRKAAKSFQLFSLVRYAAAAVLLFSIGYFGYLQMTKDRLEIAQTSNNVIKNLDLADGSKISLNQYSYLSYPEQFNGAERRVRLDGEGFFDIAKNPNQPFIVELEYGEVKVLGTSFNIEVDKAAKTATVTVATGRVEFAGKDNQEKHILTPNDKVIYDYATKKYIKESDNSKNDWSWKTQSLAFQNTRLTKAIDALEKHFGIKIKASKEILDCQYITASFQNEKEDIVFEVLEQTTGLKIQKTSSKEYLMSGICQ